MTKSYLLELSDRGQVVIPKEIRDQLGSKISLVGSAKKGYKVISAKQAVSSLVGILKTSNSVQSIKNSLRSQEKHK